MNLVKHETGPKIDCLNTITLHLYLPVTREIAFFHMKAHHACVIGYLLDRIYFHDFLKNNYFLGHRGIKVGTYILRSIH